MNLREKSKPMKVPFTSCVLIFLYQIASAQDFQNLDFSDGWNDGAIPGWIGASGYNSSPYIYNEDPGIIDASYLALGTRNGSSYLIMDANNNSTSQISQAGIVPADAQSLIIMANGYELNTFVEPSQVIDQFPLLIAFNGLQLNLIQISPTEYGVNIPTFAGQTVNVALTDNANPLEGFVNLYDIQFSNTAIPEPAICGLMWAFAMIGLAFFPSCFIRLRARCGRLAGQ
jgi:hypothetical protein